MNLLTLIHKINKESKEKIEKLWGRIRFDQNNYTIWREFEYERSKITKNKIIKNTCLSPEPYKISGWVKVTYKNVDGFTVYKINKDGKNKQIKLEKVNRKYLPPHSQIYTTGCFLQIGNDGRNLEYDEIGFDSEIYYNGSLVSIDNYGVYLDGEE
jgi:hypothetical protein